MSARPELRIFAGIQELAAEAADLFVWQGNQTIQAGRPGRRFRVALAGGSTPKALHAALTVPSTARQLDWTKVDFFFGDERCVPPDHAESNFGMANETLFQPLGIAEAQIFRMQGESSDPEAAAKDYEAAIRKQFGAPQPAWPSFDVILLGLGEDGHTASLFPHTPVLNERARLVVPNRSPKGIPQRLTLTVPVVNQAQTVVFLVSGSGKAAAVKAVLEDRNSNGAQWPAKLIRPERGRLLWLLDHPAAAQLTVERQQIESNEE
jgi:6-phosphogluconolactonase